jgi:hypothetical protein
MEGNGGGLICGTNLKFASSDQEKLQKTSVDTVNLQAEVWNQDFFKEEC